MRSSAFFFLVAGALSTAVAAQPFERGDRHDAGGRSRQVNEHMEDIQQLMQEIKNTRDPQRRQELLRRHEQAMQRGMHIMNGPGKSGAGLGGAAPNIEERMDSLQQRMEMTQEMMNQMIEHQAQEE